jgi:hypothetical protein
MLAVVVETSMSGVGDSQVTELQQDLVVEDEQRRSRVEEQYTRSHCPFNV